METRPDRESDGLAAWARHYQNVAQQRRTHRRPRIRPLGVGRRGRRSPVIVFLVVGLGLMVLALSVL
jgi:hypothetical protein